ncbi:hypothetical protein PVK62_17455 [Aliivibrio sp. S3MY1]|uniref:hypothetical protein n=1 Tax=unclassified Aliivibrio TaxID=2645654 RepID=UPI0023791A8A|nr:MULTISPECIES: hypothetical protein [unclassified Aliivibrio]MDD9197605.1 hypothetical protein [Aliivibrio sp. S3MY1]MDD9200856.1 hypothetical protein [Aliivibrio sp. S2MY1]
MSKLLMTFIVLLLTGCSASPVIYNPENIPTNQLAKIEVKPFNSWVDLFSTIIENVVVPGEGVVIDKRTTQISVPPGRYNVAFVCKNSYQEGYPNKYFVLKAGSSVVVKCEKISGHSKVRIVELSADEISELKTE